MAVLVDSGTVRAMNDDRSAIEAAIVEVKRLGVSPKYSGAIATALEKPDAKTDALNRAQEVIDELGIGGGLAPLLEALRLLQDDE